MPNHPTTPLASGTITNHDQITVTLIEATDGTRRTYTCIGRYASQQPPPRTNLL